MIFCHKNILGLILGFFTLFNMAWYIPFTIIPGVALLILSTTNLIISLNTEIQILKKEGTEELGKIVKLKLAQLTRLSIAISFLYLGVLLLLLSGIAQGFGEAFQITSRSLLMGAVLFVSIAILILIIYSLKAVVIRVKHLSITPSN